MKSQMAIGILALTLLMLPAAAVAQDPATSLDELLQSRQLRPGDGVYITDATGKRIKGDVTDVSPTGLEITDGRDTWTLAESEVSKIELQDPVETGIWLGIGIAVGSTIAVCAMERAAGAGIGWYMDATNHKTIYRKSGAARLRIAPVVSKERLGAQVSGVVRRSLRPVRPPLGAFQAACPTGTAMPRKSCQAEFARRAAVGAAYQEP